MTMRLPMLFLTLALLTAGPGNAQAPGGAEWDTLSIEAGYVEIDLGSARPKSIRGNASIIIVPTQPDQEELRVRAEEISFDVDSAGALSRAIFDKNVRINHPVGTINAGHADWNLQSNVVEFTGSPVITSERFKEAKANKITLNLTTNSMVLEGQARITDAQLAGGDEAPAGPALLTESHVKDWPALIGKLKQDAAAAGANPSKQVLATLDAKSRQMFDGATADMLLQNKGQVVKMLNNALKSPKFYAVDAWAGIELSAETQALIKQAPQGGEALTTLNRQLLAAAFPAEIAG